MSDANRPLLFVGGPVLTQDAVQPRAAWVWVEGGVVHAVGSGTPPEIAALRFDLQGRTLAPAFCDAHMHLTWLATSLLGPDLSQCGRVGEALEVLRAWGETTGAPGRGSDGSWIVGHGMDESTWAERRLPSRTELDDIESARPVLLQRVCGHIAVLNSAGLARAAPGPHTEAVSGRIAEDDLFALNDRLRPGHVELMRVFPRIAATLHANGITAVHDVTPAEMLRALHELRLADRLDVRVSCALPVKQQPQALGIATRARQATADDPWLRVLGIKLFVDGSLGARTAYLREPYDDAPETRGEALYRREELAAIGRRAHDGGLQLMVHAIGDAALQLAIEALEPLGARGNPLRHRLEHVEVTPADLIARLAHSALRACVQPNFAGRWSQPGGMNEQRLGRSRLQHCNAYHSLLSGGVSLAFGSDGMPLGPAYGLESAVHHPVATERLEFATALELYTAAAAEITGAEARLGRITPGRDADLVVLEPAADPAGERRPALPGSLASAMRIAATFVQGKQVYPEGERPG